MRHAQYRSDRDLQAAHAATAWLMVWDDHEVENGYAGAYSQNKDDPSWFLRRRANAYRAYYEHMPLPDAMRPFGAHMRIHIGVDYGALLRFTMLDARQYRSPQPCPPLGRGGSTTIEECAARLDEQASLLGAQQMQVDLRGLDDVTQADTACRSLASFVVEDGYAGAQRA